jgi:hypothetical protein
LCAPDERAVRAQLVRILASASFSKSERLSKFLSFVVSESLRGEVDSLKDTVLARELYGNGQGFETAADPVVRIDARRLRYKLREYSPSLAAILFWLLSLREQTLPSSNGIRMIPLNFR